MGLLNKTPKDVKSLERATTDNLKSAEKLKKAKDEFLEARTIGQAKKELEKREKDFFGNLEQSKAEAADLKVQAEVVLEEAQKVRQAEISKRDALSLKENQLIEREKEAEKQEQKLDRMQKELVIKTTKADSARVKHESRLAELEKGLRALIDG